MVRLTTAAAWVSGGLTVAASAGIAALPLTAPPPVPSLASLRLMPEAEDTGPRAVRTPTPPRIVKTKSVKTAETTAAPTPPAAPPATSSPAASDPATAVQPSAVAEPMGPPAPTSPSADAWSETEMRTALADCLKQLAPIAAEIDVLPAPKEGACGTPAAILVKAVGNPRVELHPPAVMNCRMAAALHTWTASILQPAAKETYGQPVTRLVGTSAYVCRPRNGIAGERLSEHAFANAIDISGVALASGKPVDVLAGWGPTARDLAAAAKRETASAAPAAATAPEMERAVLKSDVPFGPPVPAGLDRKRSRRDDAKLASSRMSLGQGGDAAAASGSAAPTPDGAFLRKLHAGACGPFTTVLGPEANEAHRNHFHFDLAERQRGPYCQ